MEDRMFILCGNVIHSTEQHPVVILPDHCIGVNNGKIVFVEELSLLSNILKRNGFKDVEVIHTGPNQFIIPGFIDTHIHAPQYPNAGKGLDVGLLQWLEKYTYPTEAKFKDKEYAAHVYQKVVDRTLTCGTTAACYYATTHTDSSMLLCDIVAKAGQRALVGKVNANFGCPDDYREVEEESVSETKRFIEEVLERNYDRVSPIVTPRFALACSERLMKRLGDLAKEYDLPVQTHMCETLDEVTKVSQTFPDSSCYTDVYDKAGLLTDKTVLGHCVYLTDADVSKIKQRQCSVSHCPNSNLSLKSGLLDLRNLLSKNIKLGLGTDISGGYHPSIMDAMRTAMHVSNVLAIQKPGYKPVDFTDVFRLATLGGAKALGLDDIIGNFEVGKQFDALHIDLACQDSPVDIFDEDTLLDTFQKFIYNGDDRNIKTVYVGGRSVHSKQNKSTNHVKAVM